MNFVLRRQDRSIITSWADDDREGMVTSIFGQQIDLTEAVDTNPNTPEATESDDDDPPGIMEDEDSDDDDDDEDLDMPNLVEHPNDDEDSDDEDSDDEDDEPSNPTSGNNDDNDDDP